MVAEARLGLATIIFTYCFGVIPQRKLLVFTTLVTIGFYNSGFYNSISATEICK